MRLKQQLNLDSSISRENNTLLNLAGVGIKGVTPDGKSLNLDLKKGEVHAIMGESGSGKTGLAYLLAGLQPPEYGRILLDGKPVFLKNPIQAINQGIGVVFKNISFIPNMTVKEYLFLGSHNFIVFGRGLNLRAKRVLDEYGINIKPNQLLLELNQEELRLVSILKTLAKKPRLLVLDEPTNDLRELKKSQVFRLIRSYPNEDQAVIYLSNKLEELLRVGDRLTVLKDGSNAGEYSVEYARRNPERVLSVYFGRDAGNSPSDEEFREVIDTVLHTTELLTSEYELQDLLNLLVKKISNATKADACNILLIDNESQSIVKSFYHSESNLENFEVRPEIIQEVITGGEPLMISDIAPVESAHFFNQTVAVRAVACVPIRIRSKISGAIEVFYSQNKNFSKEEIDILQTFAVQVAIALENTRLLGRSTLLKEAHHRIKNNLQSIISILLLQLNSQSKKDLESIVWEIIDRIKTIAAVHEILSQDEKSIGLISLANLFSIIVSNYNQKGHSERIHIRLEIADRLVSYKIATTLGLICNELLANCFEHAFQNLESGKVLVSLDHDGEEIRLQVWDNGVGIKPEVLAGKRGSLGLALVESLVKRDLHGKMEVANKNGTMIVIRFSETNVIN